MAREHEVMQQMLDRIVLKLASLGLVLNAGKTKVMVVPPLGSSDQQYQKLRAETIARGFSVTRAGKPPAQVEVVDEFIYLGVCLWWRWDWSRAWQHARARAWKAFHILQDGGLSTASMSMQNMLQTVRSLVLSHLDIVAQLSGAISPGEMQRNEELERAVLKMISGCPCRDSQVAALRMETGLWDQETRAQMLILRFACKLAASACDSLPRRVMELTHRALSLNINARGRPAAASAGQPCFQSWSQALLSAVRAFEAAPGTLVQSVACASLEQAMFRAQPCDNLVEVVCVEGGPDGWWYRPVARNDVDVPGQLLATRSTHYGARAKNYATGELERIWFFPEHTTIAEAWLQWSSQLREAEHVSLRERGNKIRQVKVRQQLEEWVRPDAEMREYVQWKSSSYLEPYWFSADVEGARQLLRARLDVWGNEASYRRVPRAEGVRVEFSERACYLCAGDAWMPETLEHLALHCKNPRVVGLRERVRSALSELSAAAPSLALVVKPDLRDDAVFFALLQCCTGAGQFRHRTDPAPADADLTTRRRHPELTIGGGADGGSLARVRAAAQWSSHWAGVWTRDLADQSGEASTGRRLVAEVCGFWRVLRSVRARLLRRRGSGFRARARDPGGVRQARVAACQEFRQLRESRRLAMAAARRAKHAAASAAYRDKVSARRAAGFGRLQLARMRPGSVPRQRAPRARGSAGRVGGHSRQVPVRAALAAVQEPQRRPHVSAAEWLHSLDLSGSAAAPGAGS